MQLQPPQIARTWSDCLFDFEYGDYEDIRSLAFDGGVLYCHFPFGGVVGSFKVEQQEWKLHPSPLPGDGSVIESRDSEILLTAHASELPWHFIIRDVFRLDRSEMKWVKLENLDDKVLFLSPTSSMSLPAAGKASKLANTIHHQRYGCKSYAYNSKSPRQLRHFPTPTNFQLGP
ncbi:hypothetical protein ACOSQ4_002855 [Xanthoceras sorbifolium]